MLYMDVLPVAKFKADFSDILTQVQQGKMVGVSYGRKKRSVAVLVPYTNSTSVQRQLGLLQYEAKFKINKNFKINDEELLSIVPEYLLKKIAATAKIQNKDKIEVIRQALERGISKIQKSNNASARALINIANIGRKYKLKGPRDSSEKMDEYLWSKDWN